MLKSCKYCGRVHDEHFNCGRKNDIERGKAKTRAQKFRSTQAWRNLRDDIVKRDGYHCLVCEDIYGKDTKKNYTDISVHHIVPIMANDDLKEDEDNLITLCSLHHWQADHNILTKEYLRGLIK